MSDKKTKTLRKVCPHCHKAHYITVDIDELCEGYTRMAAGQLIQNCFPTWTPSQREFMNTGICDECWSKL